MSNFLSGFKMNQSQATSSIVSMLSTTINRVNSYATKFNSAGSSITRSFMNGLKTNVTQIQTTFTDKLSSTLTAVRSYGTQFKLAGESLANNFKNGARNVDISGGFQEAISSAIYDIRNEYLDFYKAGKYLVEGFEDGIKKNTYLATTAAADLGTKALESLKKGADERSPSHTAHLFGRFLDMGFANGITDSTSLATEASENLGAKAINALRNTISNLGTMVEDGIDVEPTIRPVLDLSNFQSGIGQIDGMLDANRTMSLGYSGIITGRLSDTTNAISQREQLTILRRMSTMMDNYFPQFRENDIYLDTGVIAGSVNRKLGLQT